MFSPVQIVATAVISAIVSAAFLVGSARWSNAAVIRSSEIVLVAAVVGISVLFWRLAGNTAALNEDPIALVSPNDVLCPVLTYVSLEVYAGLRGIASVPGWARTRAALTLLSLIVNVVTI